MAEAWAGARGKSIPGLEQLAELGLSVLWLALPKQIVMGETEYLAGRVVKWSLPVISGRPAPDAPVLKRLMLAQGELAQFHDDEEGIHYMAVIEARAGCVRGNHYHKVKRERIYVLRGELRVVVEDIQTKARASVPLRTGDLVLIPTGIAHALQTVQPGEAIEFGQVRFDAADIYPYPLA